MDIFPTTLSIVFWSLAAIAFALTFVMLARRYGDLPEEIPVHFGITGKPDAWGGRILIWPLPISMLMMVGFVLALATVDPPDEPQEIEVPSAMALYVGIVTLTITWRMIAVAMGRAKTLGWYTFAVIFVPILLLVIYALR